MSIGLAVGMYLGQARGGSVVAAEAVDQSLTLLMRWSTAVVETPVAGVPNHVPDFDLSTEAWWLTHWANSASSAYVATGEIVTHPNVVDVSAPDLQAAIDAAPDNTTFRLAAGTYNGIKLTGRRGIHVIAANPAAKPILQGLFVHGHATLDNAGANGYSAFVLKVVTNNAASELAAYLDPPRDFLFRDIDFRPASGAITTWETGSGNAAGMVGNQFWPGNNLACWLNCVADVCFERCDWSGWKMADSSDNNTGPIANGAHNGHITAGSGVRNIVIRDCTMTGSLYGSGLKAWPYAVYLDGPMGCALVGNDFTGPFNSGTVLLLTNDDYAPTSATAYDGIAGYNPVTEMPSARYNAIEDNDHFIYLNCVGRNTLVANNRSVANGTAFYNIEFPARKQSHSPGLIYDFRGNVVRDNVLVGRSTVAYVRFNMGTQGPDPLVGEATITGNQVSGVEPLWYTFDTSTGGSLSTPMVVTGNTDSNGTRDGV